MNRAGTEPRGHIGGPSGPQASFCRSFTMHGPMERCCHWEPTPLVVSDWSTLDAQAERGPIRISWPGITPGKVVRVRRSKPRRGGVPPAWKSREGEDGRKREELGSVV